MTICDLAEVYELGLSQVDAESWPMLYRSWDEYEVTTRFHVDGEYCLVAENNDEDSSRRIVGFVLGSVVSKPGSAVILGVVILQFVSKRQAYAPRFALPAPHACCNAAGAPLLPSDLA